MPYVDWLAVAELAEHLDERAGESEPADVRHDDPMIDEEQHGRPQVLLGPWPRKRA